MSRAGKHIRPVFGVCVCVVDAAALQGASDDGDDQVEATESASMYWCAKNNPPAATNLSRRCVLFLSSTPKQPETGEDL